MPAGALIGTPSRRRPSRAAAPLARLIERLEPAVVVTYDPDGGYGHPDHIQAHRVLMRAVESVGLAGAEGLRIAVPRSVAGDAIGSTSVVLDDDLVTSAIDGAAVLDRKVAAMRAHATQIEVAEPDFALSNGIWQPIAVTEYFRLVAGTSSPPYDADGREIGLLYSP